MVKNMGKTDKVIRIVAALVLGVLIIAGTLRGAAAVVLGFIALVLLGTSVMGSCPLYLPFKIDTRKKSEK